MQKSLREENDELRKIALAAQNQLAELRGDPNRPAIIQRGQNLLSTLTPYVGIRIEKATYQTQDQTGVTIVSLRGGINGIIDVL